MFLALSFIFLMCWIFGWVVFRVNAASCVLPSFLHVHPGEVDPWTTNTTTTWTLR